MINRQIIFLAASAIAAATNAIAAPSSCTIENIRKFTPASSTVDRVTAQPGPVPHCEVRGHALTRDPTPNRVEWSVMLPDARFNGRYYFVGEGDVGGAVPTAAAVGEYPNAWYINTTIKLLSEGFAVAGTDTGHKTAPGAHQWEFGVNNPGALRDFAGRAAHLSAEATQAITRGYYAMNVKLNRYAAGCSRGGGMSAEAAYYYPKDYDGIVSNSGFHPGVPWFVSVQQHIIRHPDAWVSPKKLAFLEAKVTEMCAGPDGLVRDPKSCGFNPASLQCKAGDRDDCLTAAELTTVKVYTDPTPTGPGTKCCGFTLTNPTAWSSTMLGMTRPTNMDQENPWAPEPSPLFYPVTRGFMRGVYFNDINYNFITDFDFSRKSDLEKLRDGHANWFVNSYDISGFKQAGGKLILWTTLGEQAIPPSAAIEAYDAFKQRDPNTDDYVRLYTVPGTWHCGGGKGPQDTPDRLLEKVIAWVEQGKRPDAVTVSAPVLPLAMNSDQTPSLVAPPPTRTVLLCPYPQTAVFNAKKGDFAFDAANWRCE